MSWIELTLDESLDLLDLEKQIVVSREVLRRFPHLSPDTGLSPM